MLTTVGTKRLLVSRQDPETKRFTRVGVLSCQDDRYAFSYDDDVKRALPGLPLGRDNVSDSLFPVFAERVMHPLRPDRERTLAQLGLPPEAGPFEVLAVSGGRRTGDTYELTPLPEPGLVALQFLVHGVRHLSGSEREAIDTLVPGQLLDLIPEPDNEYNERALLVTADGSRLGYVPDPLLSFVHPIMRQDFTLEVLRVNDVEAGLHMRLLVELHGRYDG
ncbi:hypothetical protein ACVW00_003546 [Marmoricola sp. URHA0025 HA25]